MDRLLIAALLLIAVAVATAAYRARSRKHIGSIDPHDFGIAGDGLRIAGFTSPYCLPCQQWTEQLAEHGIQSHFVDVSERPELARKYDVDATPVVLLTEMPEGRVMTLFSTGPQPGQIEELAAAGLR